MPDLQDGLSSTIRDAIREGTFPDSNEILTSNLSIHETPALLNAIALAREDLNHDIKGTSQDVAGDVDQWMTQAKRVQDDIARCKIEARQIVLEHERVEALRTASEDAKNKVKLLETEVGFTEALQNQLHSISAISEHLDYVQEQMLKGNFTSAVARLVKSGSAIDEIAVSKTRSLLQEIYNDLHGNTHRQLLMALDTKFVVNKDEENVKFQVISGDIPDGFDNGQVTNKTHPSLEEILKALGGINSSPDAISLVAKKLESSIFIHFSINARHHASASTQDGSALVLSTSSALPVTRDVIAALQEIVKYLHLNLPSSIQRGVLSQVFPKVLSMLVIEWLDPAIPMELYDLRGLGQVQTAVAQLSSEMSTMSWPGVDVLESWTNQIPRTWLTKRRTSSLDGIRTAFNLARGATRQVERIEQQTVLVEHPVSKDTDPNVENDWDEHWGDEDEDKSKSTEKSDGVEDEDDAWGFGNDDDDEPKDKKPGDEDDGTDEAWGWGDESPTNEKKETKAVVGKVQQNGAQQKPPLQPYEEVLTLTELYTITDIPDYILEIIGKDLRDAHEIRDAPSIYFQTSSTSTGLSGTPTLILAMFRATAPTYYSLSSSTGNMNLYNDSLYISQKLRENSSSSTASMGIDCACLDKFARTAYSREMDIQRTILNDLLDGAQGFNSCTKFPYAQECETAVSSTVDRIRAVHHDWVSILSPSHLQQAIGALLSSVISKIIKDIEDMEDISEPESACLHFFCDQISSLSDLFSTAPRPPSSAANHTDTDETEPTSSVAVFVPNWLRFQYLMQILDSSLVDIKYLWTDAGLSIEFSSDEVVDLIKALFAESTHRRNAIVAIRA